MKPVFVIDSVRTPVGKYGGALSNVRPDDLLAYVIKSLLHRNQTIDVNAIEDVIAGDANQAGEDNRNVARMAALLAAGENRTNANRFCHINSNCLRIDHEFRIVCGGLAI